MSTTSAPPRPRPIPAPRPRPPVVQPKHVSVGAAADMASERVSSVEGAGTDLMNNAQAMAEKKAQEMADAATAKGAAMLQAKLAPVAAKFTKKEKVLENRVTNEVAYAIMGALGPFGEPLQAAYAAMRDAQPAVESAQTFLEILVPILQQAEANQESVSLQGATVRAMPLISKTMEEHNMPVTAAMLKAAQSPELQAKIDALKEAGNYEDEHGKLTAEAQSILHEHALAEVKKIVPAKHHEQLDVAYSVAAGKATPEQVLAEAKTVVPAKHHEQLDVAYSVATGKAPPKPAAAPQTTTPTLSPPPLAKYEPSRVESKPVAVRPTPTLRPRTQRTQRTVRKKGGGRTRRRFKKTTTKRRRTVRRRMKERRTIRRR